ncbi:hypothetical protein GCM10023216_18810 [Isoptericola chiayiensis]|uniref:Uncharacterized protein n=1 Tax=Isoptericola chiayiensis TaxID=579446 RepID=A0ABP8YG09_9MICO
MDSGTRLALVELLSAWVTWPARAAGVEAPRLDERATLRRWTEPKRRTAKGNGVANGRWDALA